MKILGQFLIILFIWQVGEYIHTILPFSLPGSIIGMLILFILLSFNIIKLQWVEECAELLLKKLSFFFIPAGVSLIASLDLLKANLLPLSIITTLSTIIVMGITGRVVQKIVKD